MADPETGDAHYVFRVRFRLAPAPPDVDVDPETFETTLSRRAAIRDDLAAFRADSVDAALSKYLGSSIHVTREN
jgi:hypothetical protein